MLGKDLHFQHGFVSASVLIAMFGTGLAAALMLKPWEAERTEVRKPGRAGEMVPPVTSNAVKAIHRFPPSIVQKTVGIIALVLLSFLMVGWKVFPEPVDEKDTMRMELRKTQDALNELTKVVKTNTESQRSNQKIDLVSAKVANGTKLDERAHSQVKSVRKAE